MRLLAYKECVNKAMELPEEISSLESLSYNPREQAISYIKKQARFDVDKLLDIDFIDLFEYIKEKEDYLFSLQKYKEVSTNE